MTEEIKVGDIVYQKKKGWSGIPMEVLVLYQPPLESALGVIALCKGAMGWGLNGLYSVIHNARVSRYPVDNLTHEPNSQMKGG